MTIFYGAAYHPEFYPEERWKVDAALMRQAHFNVVRIGEFAWGRMEPAINQFDFEWLDKAIETLNAQGIQVMVGTPTAGPPTWITHPRNGQPDCRMLYEDGIRWEAGSRSHCCVNHPFFIERARRIAQALGLHYAGHPGVVGFQLDNEIGMFGTRCYCATCLTDFRSWLERKYGTIAELNERLGMLFGGNEFRDFEDIPLPRKRQEMHNPGLLLDSQRFYSDCTINFIRVQSRALQEAGVKQPITSNVCHMFSGSDSTNIDMHALFAELDVVGWDCYPSQFASDPTPATLGLLHSIARGYKDQRYWMLEQQSGSPDGLVAEDPRRIRLWSWQAIAYGAAMILYWLWRSHRAGAEQYWRGILNHDGEINIRYQMIAQLGAELQRLAPLLESLERKNEVALLLDFDSSQSLALVPPTSDLAGPSYRQHAEAFFAALQTLGIVADVVYDTTALKRYRVVIAPMLRMIDETTANGLKTYVQQGGKLIASVLTATLNREHVAPVERPPALLQELLGVERIEWGSLGAVTTPPKELTGIPHTVWASLQTAKGAIPVQAVEGHGFDGVYSASRWYDQLQIKGAEVLATFAEGSPVPNAPALTRHQAGQGEAFYIASILEQRFYVDLLRSLLNKPEGPIQTNAETENLEIVSCTIGNKPVYFILNHSKQDCTLQLAGGFYEAITETEVQESITLSGYGVAILKSHN